jgi:Domain of unknown function (DUF4281)
MPTPDLIFSLANSAALLAWLALAVSPPSARWTPTVWRLTGRVLPFLFSLVYVPLIATNLGGEGGFGSITDVQKLFAVPGALVAGWVHYLAFDLFVGTWIAQRSAALKIPHAMVLPLLVLTFMFGPAGLLAFVLVRAWLRPQSLSFAGSASAPNTGSAS